MRSVGRTREKKRTWCCCLPSPWLRSTREDLTAGKESETLYWMKVTQSPRNHYGSHHAVQHLISAHSAFTHSGQVRSFYCLASSITTTLHQRLYALMLLLLLRSAASEGISADNPKRSSSSSSKVRLMARRTRWTSWICSVMPRVSFVCPDASAY